VVNTFSETGKSETRISKLETNVNDRNINYQDFIRTALAYFIEETVAHLF